MEKKNGFGMAFLFIVIGMLIAAIIGLSIWVYTLKKEEPKQESNTGVTDNNQNAESRNNEIAENENQIESNIPSEEELYGTYSWEKKFVNEYGNELDLKVVLVLNSDGTAKYRASSGYEAEYTKGTFLCKNGKVEYKREFYDYDNSENKEFTDENNRIETFVIIDKNTLQSTYYDQTVTLVKNNNDFSNVEIKKCLQNYLDIYGAFRGSPEGMLVKMGLMEHNEYKDIHDNYVKTDIKYSDFKNELLKYITEDWFKECIEKATFFKDVDGVLYYSTYAASGCEFEIIDIKAKDSSSYTADIYYFVDPEYKTEETISFSVESYNGRCVISNCEYSLGVGG